MLQRWINFHLNENNVESISNFEDDLADPKFWKGVMDGINNKQSGEP